MLARLSLPVLFVALTAAGCSGSDEEALAPGTFTLRVDGGAARTYVGSALFGQDASGGQPLFGISLGATAGAGEPEPNVFFIRPGAAPRPGRYPLADLVGTTGIPDLSGFFGVYIDPDQAFDPEQPPDLEPGGELPGFYYARSGTVTIDRIEASDAVEGSFVMSVQSVRMVGFNPDDPESGPGSVEPVGEPVAVEGEFNASFRRGLFSDVAPVSARLPRLASSLR